MAGETEEQWFPHWEFGGDPSQSEKYDKFGPSRYADKFQTLTLVIAGERDYRVPMGQALQFLPRYSIAEVPSRLLLFRVKITGS